MMDGGGVMLSLRCASPSHRIVDTRLYLAAFYKI